jgi:hypothetical protein
MTGAGGGVGWHQGMEGGGHVAASLTLLQITGVDLINPQSKTLARMRGLQCRLFAKLT